MNKRNLAKLIADSIDMQIATTRDTVRTSGRKRKFMTAANKEFKTLRANMDKLKDAYKGIKLLEATVERQLRELGLDTGRGLKYDSFSDMMTRLYNEQTSDLILEQINTLREQKTKLLAELDLAETVEQARAVLKAAGVDLSLTDDNKGKKA